MRPSEAKARATGAATPVCTGFRITMGFGPLPGFPPGRVMDHQAYHSPPMDRRATIMKSTTKTRRRGVIDRKHPLGLKALRRGLRGTNLFSRIGDASFVGVRQP